MAVRIPGWSKSLRSLGLTPDDVRVVSKHDTSTNANDPNESQLHTVLWQHLGRDVTNPMFVISQKSLTGHAKGGAALFQIGGLIDVFKNGKLPQNASLDCVDKAIEPKAKSLVWLRKPLEIGEVKAGVLTSLGFGHVAAVVVLAHPGVFAKVAGEEWRERATKRLRDGQRAFETGMLNRGEFTMCSRRIAACRSSALRLPKSRLSWMTTFGWVRMGSSHQQPTNEHVGAAGICGA